MNKFTIKLPSLPLSTKIVSSLPVFPTKIVSVFLTSAIREELKLQMSEYKPL
jgi:hypothetical protein